MDERPLNRFQRRKLRTQQKLKEAAIALILEKGYDSVTIQDITDRADLARATFYIHFKDKEELLWDAIRVGWASFPDKLQQLQNSQGDKPALYYGLLFDFKLAEENSDLYRIILGGGGPQELVKRAKENIVADIQTGITNGQFAIRSDNPIGIVAEFMVGAIGELIAWWLNTPNNHSAEEMAEMAYQMFTGVV